MDVLGIIPARYKSTRFPGKPLALLGDKTVIQRVYEQSHKVLDEIYVATDDERIFSHVQEFGGNVIMTSDKHPSGTDRCREAMDSIIAGTGIQPGIVINIQGDEPFIDPDQIKLLVSSFEDERTDIATLVKRVASTNELFDENKPKVVFDNSNFALYFSRSVIPFLRGEEKENWINHHDYYRHIGIYAYRKDVLHQITRLSLSGLEVSESLEQLRWLENGFRIKVAQTEYDSLGIDTPADLEKARHYLNK